jgi:hypothetical protein
MATTIWIRSVLSGILVLIASGESLAQAELGNKVPGAEWGAWLRGEPVEFGGKETPKCTAFAFYSHKPAGFDADASVFVRLQRRHVASELRIISVVASEKTVGIDLWTDCSVVVDEKGVIAQDWLPVEDKARDYVVLCDADGTATFFGVPGAGLVDAIDRILDGNVDLETEIRAASVRANLPCGFDDAEGAETLELLKPLVEYAPRDGLLSGLLYLTLARKLFDQPASRALLLKATDRLQDDARALAIFADLVLRGGKPSPSDVLGLRVALEATAVASKLDSLVQLAYLRALIVTGDTRDAGRQVMRMRAQVMKTAQGCLDYAALLASDENPQIHADLAAVALERAKKLGGNSRLLYAARYCVALRCGDDECAAEAILASYLKDQSQAAGINNDSWYFMTEIPSMGRYDWFAVGLVECLLKDRDSMDDFELDTAALAMFLVGRYSEAVELQEQAVKDAGEGANSAYQDRLARYKSYLAPAPR